MGVDAVDVVVSRLLVDGEDKKHTRFGVPATFSFSFRIPAVVSMPSFARWISFVHFGGNFFFA